MQPYALFDTLPLQKISHRLACSAMGGKFAEHEALWRTTACLDPRSFPVFVNSTVQKSWYMYVLLCCSI